MRSIKPFLWFDNNAEEAVRFYLSVFPDSAVTETMMHPENGGVLTIGFMLSGETFTAMNGGPHFTMSPAVSFFVSCDTQAEIDYFWDKLGDGGEIRQCGWLTDRYGVTWQIAPANIIAMMCDPDRTRAARAFKAMTGMVKLDIAALQSAYDQG